MKTRVLLFLIIYNIIITSSLSSKDSFELKRMRENKSALSHALLGLRLLGITKNGKAVVFSLGTFRLQARN